MKNIFFILISYQLIFSTALPIQENSYDYVPIEKFRVMCPYEFDLCGIDVTMPIYVSRGVPLVWGNESSTRMLILTNVYIIYTDSTDATTPITNQIHIGKPLNKAYFASYTPKASQAQWTVDTIAAANLTNQGIYNDGTHDVMLVQCHGGKAGIGKVMIVCEFSKNNNDMTLTN